MAINKPLIGQDSSSDSSGEEVGGTTFRLQECVCSKYENMKQKMKICENAELCGGRKVERRGETMNEKEQSSCVIDMDKDIDESMETVSIETESRCFGRKAEYTRTFDVYSASTDLDGFNPFRDNDDVYCDIDYSSGANNDNDNGNHGNWRDKTIFGFYGDPERFCRERCSAGRPGATHTSDNIEDCGDVGPPGGGCCENRKPSVMNDVPYKVRRRDLFVKDHELEEEGDIDKTQGGGEVSLEYLSLSGCYKITDKGLRLVMDATKLLILGDMRILIS